MPELPEVETVARQLSPLVSGRVLERVVLRDELLKGARAPRGSRGRPIRKVFRYGKQVLFDLDDLYLAVHLRMTGRLIWTGEARRSYDHLRAVFELDDGAVLFIDTRRFGTIRWMTDPRQAVGGPEGMPAVDPMTDEFTVASLDRRLGNSKQELKAWLLRQDRIVGLGNIYASEILHDARLSPMRAAGSLSAEETGRLHRSTRKVLELAIANCGTTFSDFQDAHGVTGSYQQYLEVYGRDDEPCPRCETKIVRVVQQQRSTFYCPGCVS